jgi:DNA-binding NarL/FixJ family response regulator
MKILFHDDAPDRRQKPFRRVFPHAVFARSNQAAVRHLESTAFDVLFLDHDLEEQPGYKGETGFELVEWICRNHPAIGKIVIHSTNSKADEMKDSLRTHGYDVKVLRFEPTIVEWLKVHSFVGF